MLPDNGSNKTSVSRSVRSPPTIMLMISLLLAGAADAAAAGNTGVVRDLASRVGPVVGSALACRDIARPRIQIIVDKFAAVIREASSIEAERAELTQLLDRSVAEGRNAVTSGQTDCKLADRQLGDLERSIAAPNLSAAIGPSSANAATSIAPVTAGPPQRGITDREIRFGIAAPFSGSAKELGRQMKLGIDTAFNRVNDAGGVEGRMLRLVAADDGYEPSRTAEAM